MFHKIELEVDSYGKNYIKRIYFDTADILNFFDEFDGYEGKTFEQLMEDGEIKLSLSGEVVHGGDVLEFERPISLDRFLLIFGKGVSQRKEDLEGVIEVDKDCGFYAADPKKYVF